MANIGMGDPAPDFKLPGTDGEFSLSAHLGGRVVLLFYPGDNTPVCTKQFCSYRDRAEDVEGLGATIVGISDQDLDSHAAFKAKHGLNIPLLADVDKAVAKLFGVTAPVLGTRRAVFIIDEQGVIRYRQVSLTGLSFESVDDVREALAATA